MARESLVRLASLLGHSCRASLSNDDDSCKVRSGEQPNSGNEELAATIGPMNRDDDPLHPTKESCTLTFPSFSLQHLCEESSVDRKRHASPSREEVQAKASSLLSRPVVVTIDTLQGGELSSSSSLSSPQQMILQNILESFDQLVDARIRAYSKILRNHYLSLASVKWNNNDTSGGLQYSSNGGVQIVEYKLRTLLEFGTNISFGSITTTFTPRTMTEDEEELGGGASASSSASSSLPVLFTVTIEPIQFSSFPSKDRAHQETSPFLQLPSSVFPNKKLSFQAPGFIHGMFSNSAWGEGNNDEAAMTPGRRAPVAADTAMTRSSNTTASCNEPSASLCPGASLPVVASSIANAVIDIDCEALLSTMIEEASRVVGMVVELTNEAWAENIQNLGMESNASSFMAGGSNEDPSPGYENGFAHGPPNPANAIANADGSSNKVEVVSRSPNLGAKKVSEVSFDPLKLEGAEDLQFDDDKKPSSAFSARWESHLEESESDDDCNVDFDKPVVDRMLHDDHHADFSDEENLNPFISAEKASHIVDYVFGEIDDQIIVVPPRPTKKARIEEC